MRMPVPARTNRPYLIALSLLLAAMFFGCSTASETKGGAEAEHESLRAPAAHEADPTPEAGSEPASPPPATQPIDDARRGAALVQVERVVDGDTVVLVDGRRVRLVQIDTPEIHQDPECYGAEATAALEELLPAGGQVELEVDPALDAEDRYGRVLGYLIADGQNLNVELVRRGAAGVWFFRGARGRYAEELLAAAEEARRAERGLWGACPDVPFDPERSIDTGPAGARGRW